MFLGELVCHILSSNLRYRVVVHHNGDKMPCVSTCVIWCFGFLYMVMKKEGVERVFFMVMCFFGKGEFKLDFEENG